MKKLVPGFVGLVVAGVVVSACADAAPSEESARGDMAAEGAPTLVEIMRQLEVDMERVAHGIWVEDFDSIAVAARAVADHPQVGPDERAEILGILGEGGVGFRQADMRVHDLSIELAERARAEDMPGVLQRLSVLQAACVGCHTGYRQTLRDARPPAGDR